MAATPIYGFRYPSTGDTPHGPDQIKHLAEDVETKIASIDALQPGQIVARARRTTASTTTTTEIGVLRLDDLPIVAGKLYEIVTSPLGLDSNSTNDEIFAQFRYTTDGSTPTTSSAVLLGSRTQTRQTDSNVPEPKVIITTYTPASNETFSLLLCVGRIAGAGNVGLSSAPASEMTEFIVVYLGTDPGNTGTAI